MADATQALTGAPANPVPAASCAASGVGPASAASVAQSIAPRSRTGVLWQSGAWLI